MVKMRGGRGFRPRRLEMLVGLGAFVILVMGTVGWLVLTGSDPQPAILVWMIGHSLAMGILGFGVVWATRIYSSRSHRDTRAGFQGVQRQISEAAHTVRELQGAMEKASGDARGVLDAVSDMAKTLAVEEVRRRDEYGGLQKQMREMRADMAEVRSDTEFIASVMQRPSVSGTDRRVLMVTSNGTGLGHLTRCLALARELPKNWSIDILTLSTGWRKVTSKDVNLRYFPSWQQSGLGPREWHRRFVRALSAVIDEVNPDVMFFDGTSLYRGVHEVPRHRRIPLVWIVRGGWRPGVVNEQTRNPERFADALLLPGDYAIGEETAPVVTSTLPVLRTPPLYYAPQLMGAVEARAALGLDEDMNHVLIQLGAGNIDTIGDKLQAAAEAIETLGTQWRAVVVDSPIARETNALPETVKRISAYPLSAYYGAFEFVVVAAGYNTVQEVLALGVPSLIVPNLQTVTDDQARRAEAAADAGMSLCVLTAEEIPEAIRSLGDPATRARIRDRLAALDTTERVANLDPWLEGLIRSNRAGSQGTAGTRTVATSEPDVHASGVGS